MGRVVVVNFMSIDGVIQSPLSSDEDRDGGFSRGGWVVPYSDDSVAEFMRGTTVDAAGLLLGRRSYEILADAWSNADENEPAVEAMNRIPKYVVSGSDAALPWANSRRLEGDLSRRIDELTHDVDGALVVFGSGMLVRGLAELDLVDEYRLLLFPVILGAGKRMFTDDSRFATFTLTSSTISATGVSMLTYTR